LQAAIAGAAKADRDHGLAGGVGLLCGGGPGAAAGEFQHAPQLVGAQGGQESGETDRKQRDHALVRREPVLMF
jgi:hypothetical protein